MLRRKKPIISVVIASYNHKDFVKEAINSVLKQTIKNIEVIVIDDGSSDGTDKIIEQIKDSRLRFIRLGKNRLKHPRNMGIRLAKGEYIAFQNSDDVWQDNKLELQLKAFLNHKRLAACFTGVNIIDSSGKPAKKTWANDVFTTHNRTSNEWLRHFFDKGNCLCISSAMVSKKALKKIGLFDESLVQLSDLDLWVRCAAVGDIYVLDKPLTKMRIIGNDNFSSPNPKSVRRGNMEFVQVLRRFTEKNSRVVLQEVFPDLLQNKSSSEVIQQAHLAKYAWTKSPEHRLFADRLFADLVANTQDRNTITGHFGPKIYLEFLSKRANLEMTSHE